MELRAASVDQRYWLRYGNGVIHGLVSHVPTRPIVSDRTARVLTHNVLLLLIELYRHRSGYSVLGAAVEKKIGQ